jgi:3-oxoacyl-[acyl-carrier protein] reductase
MDMTKAFEGKVALVTGGSRGIGAGAARRLAREGAAVVLVYESRRDAAEQVVQAIRAEGGRADALQADVSDQEAMRRAARQAAELHGRIDVLVHCAGIYGNWPVGQIERADFDRQLAVNTWSVVAALQAVLPHFPASGGAVVNVSTSLVHAPGGGHAVYAAAKAAVETLTRGFAVELGPRGIRVNAVAPHITRTDMTAGIPAEHRAHETALTPLGRLAEVEDVTDAIAFLASDQARWVTGRTLLTDGGRM